MLQFVGHRNAGSVTCHVMGVSGACWRCAGGVGEVYCVCAIVISVVILCVYIPRKLGREDCQEA